MPRKDLRAARPKSPFSGEKKRACRRRAACRRAPRPIAPRKGGYRPARAPAPASPSARKVAAGGEARRPARASSELERREAEQDEHHGDDPEAHHDLALLPSLELVVVVQRRHAEDALAAAPLEVK